MKKVTYRQCKRVIALALAFCMTLTGAISMPQTSAKAATTAALDCLVAAGSFESVYAQWQPVSGATAYEAYIKNAGADDSAYKRIDNELIRNYGDYYRVDAVGLRAGDYTLKVVAKTEKEDLFFAKNVSASKYDRTGFAWVNGSSNGAYNSDGTLKSNAVVLYITEETKDTVSLDVVTSNKGATTNGKGLQEILNLYKKGYDSRPLDIRVIGKVTDLATMDNGDIVISGNSASKRLSCGITVEGIGEDATVYGWGLRIKSASNVEVRNLGFMAVDSKEGDDLGLQQDNDHIWVHNCDFFYGMAGGDSDQAKGDGALDCKKSTYVTFSYNHFFDTGKSNLLGLSEGTTEGLYITYHHNWYDHSDSRHPRVRFYSAHVYNNYYDGNAKYGVGSTNGSSVYVEGNYFRNVPFPMLTSMQGSDLVTEGDKEPTFSKEDGGTIKAYNNTIIGAAHYTTYEQDNVQFDAYEVKSARETVPSTVTSVKGAHTYNNFDTSDIMYTYTLQSPEAAKATVVANAGRMNGGDFKWTFTEEDDALYSVNKELKAAITNYVTKLVSVGGTTQPVDVEPETPSTEPSSTEAATTEGTTAATTTEAASATPVEGNVVHNFTTDGKDSSVFAITGNLSTSKGTVTYEGKTLTQCLKIESSTNISFATASDATLTLVFNDGFTGKIAVDGVKKNATAGVLTVELAAGDHELTKGDTANLYYMVLASKTGEAPSTEAATEEATTEAPSTEAATEEATTVAPSTEAATEEATTVAPSTEAATEAAAEGSVVHNFTTDGTSSNFFAISGNLSDSKGTVTYDGKTLTQCLKIEKATTISFTTSAKSTLTLVFNSENSNNIKIDGNKKNLTNGILSIELAAGSHTITKADSAYLFYMALSSGQSAAPSTEATTTEAATEETTTVAPSTEEESTETTPSTEPSTETPGQEAPEVVNPTVELTVLPKGDIYVAPNGKEDADGSLENPMDFVTALTKIKAGHTIWMASGNYGYTTPIIIEESNCGEDCLYKTVSSINGGKVVINFAGMAEEGSNRGITLDGDYWHFYGIDITNAGDNGMLLSGSYNVIEMCQFYGNHDTGLQLSRYNITYANIDQWPSYNKILNCTAFNNKDEATAENADGFAAKLTCGEGNVFDGCISYCNSDDGWDLYAKPATGSIGVVTIRNCVAFGNGKLTDGTGSANGDMNGFKLGGSKGAAPTPHVVENCVAFYNGATGFTDNGNGGALTMSGCIAAYNAKYDAKKSNFACYRTNKDAKYTNLITLAPKTAETDSFYGTMTNVLYNYKKEGTIFVSSYEANGEKFKYTGSEAKSLTVSDSDFVSVTVPGYDASTGAYTADYHKIFRNADGSINLNGLFELKSTSPLATAGKDGAALGATIGKTESFSGNTKEPVDEVEEKEDDKKEDAPAEQPVVEVQPQTPSQTPSQAPTHTPAQQVIVDEPVAQAPAAEAVAEPAVDKVVAETITEPQTAEVKDDTTPLAADANDAVQSQMPTMLRNILILVVVMLFIGGIVVIFSARRKGENSDIE